VGAILLSIGIGVIMNSLNELQSSFAGNRNEVALGSVEGCVQDALLDINKLNNLTSPIVLPAGSCTVTINSHVGNSWDFTVTGTFGNHLKSIQVTATRTNLVTVNSWKEI